MRIAILAYFLTDTLSWQVLWGKEKYLLNSLYEKLKNKVKSMGKKINSRSNI